MAVPLTLSSVPAQTPYAQFVSTAGQTVFPYPFEITQDSDLIVIVGLAGQVPTVLNTDQGYTLSGQGTTGGGNLTFAIGQPAGTIITLFRQITIARITQLSQNGTFFSSNFNNEFNRIYLILQQLAEQQGFDLQVPNTNAGLANGQTILTPAAYANKYLAFDANGNPVPAVLTTSGSLTAAIITALINAGGTGIINSSVVNFPAASIPSTTLDYAQTPVELAAGVTPTNLSILPGSGDWSRYGVRGGGGRASNAVITAASAIVTSPSGQFAKAVAGMTVAITDGGASRIGGRPATLITTILSVQSANQITLNAAVTQPGTIVFTGTLSSVSLFITSPSVNPITAGVGLTRIWTASGTNIPAATTITATSPTALAMSAMPTGSGATTITLAAPITVDFGWDDSAAIAAALSLPYPFRPQVDTWLSTLPLTVGGINGGCNDLVTPTGSLLIFAIGNNTQHCITAAGFDQATLGPEPYENGMRFKQFNVNIAEYDCCNTGLDGFSVGQSYFSRMRARCVNPFRNMLSEWFTTNGTWQESNVIDISGSCIGLHFHHKVNLGSVFQNQGNYRILGRAAGLNSVYLGINASTQAAQCGGGIRIYAGGNSSVADGGISQNQWGTLGGCELDGERSIALSFGSDICNSPVTFVDASANQVIEGPAQAHFSNTYRSNLFLSMVIEDITATSDTRGGYQYYAQPNVVVNDTTILSTSAGPWGQTEYNPAVWMVLNTDNLIRNTNNISFSGSLTIVGAVGTNGNGPVAPITGWGSPTGGATIINFPGSTATLAQTSASLAQVIAQLKAFGLFGA